MFKYIIKELDKNYFWEFENYNSIKKIIKHYINYDYKYNNIYKHYHESIDKFIIEVNKNEYLIDVLINGNDILKTINLGIQFKIKLIE